MQSCGVQRAGLCKAGRVGRRRDEPSVLASVAWKPKKPLLARVCSVLGACYLAAAAV